MQASVKIGYWVEKLHSLEGCSIYFKTLKRPFFILSELFDTPVRIFAVTAQSKMAFGRSIKKVKVNFGH